MAPGVHRAAFSLLSVMLGAATVASALYSIAVVQEAMSDYWGDEWVVKSRHVVRAVGSTVGLGLGWLAARIVRRRTPSRVEADSPGG